MTTEISQYAAVAAAIGRQALIADTDGQPLEGDTLTEGVYTFALPVAGATTLEVHLTASAVTGAPTASVVKTYADGTTAKGAAVDFAAFVADTAQDAGWSDGRGERVALLTITVPAGASITLARAEYNAL